LSQDGGLVQRRAGVKEERVVIVVQVQPNTSQNKVIRFEDGILYLRIAAPAVKGKANRELLNFLSDILGVGKTSLTIVKGITNRRKVIAIEGLKQTEVTAKLKAPVF